jgi:hypothetical protein
MQCCERYTRAALDVVRDVQFDRLACVAETRRHMQGRTQENTKAHNNANQREHATQYRRCVGSGVPCRKSWSGRSTHTRARGHGKCKRWQRYPSSHLHDVTLEQYHRVLERCGEMLWVLYPRTVWWPPTRVCHASCENQRGEERA